MISSTLRLRTSPRATCPAADDAIARHERSVPVRQRVEPDEPESPARSRRQRGLDQPRFRPGAEHQDPVRHHRAMSGRTKAWRTSNSPPSARQSDDADMLLEDFATGQRIREQIGERNADEQGEDEAQRVGAGGQILDVPVEPERSVEADDQQREYQRERIGAGRRNREACGEAQGQQDGREQPAQLDAELQQHGAGNAAMRGVTHVPPQARPGGRKTAQRGCPAQSRSGDSSFGSQKSRCHMQLAYHLPDRRERRRRSGAATASLPPNASRPIPWRGLPAPQLVI